MHLRSRLPLTFHSQIPTMRFWDYVKAKRISQASSAPVGLVGKKGWKILSLMAFWDACAVVGDAEFRRRFPAR